MNDAQRKNEIRKSHHYPLHKQGMMPSAMNHNTRIARFNSGGAVRSSNYSGPNGNFMRSSMGGRGGYGRPVVGRKPMRGLRRPSMRRSPSRYNTGGFVNPRTTRRPVRGKIRGRRNFTPINRRTFRR